MDTKPMSSGSTPMDIKEYPDKYVYIMDVPGIDDRDIKVKVKETNVLVINGDRKIREEKNEEVKYVQMERKIRNIYRRFRLPFDANPHAISAATYQGVLTVTVKKFAKLEPKEPQFIQVRKDHSGQFS